MILALTLALTLAASCSSSSAPSPPPAEAGPDVALVDAGDAGEEASADSGKKSDAAVTCSPGSVADFKPTVHTQIGPYANACTVDQLTTFVNDCLGSPEDLPACDSWVNATENAGCEGCFAGNVTAAAWAPFLYVDNPGQSTYVNVAGCFLLSDPSQAMCAQLNQAAFECVIAACAPSCSVPTTGDMSDAINAFTQCIDEAGCGVCAAYSGPADDCGATLAASGPAAYCAMANANSGDLLQYFLLACGPPPADAGAPDAGAPDASDASRDGD